MSISKMIVCPKDTPFKGFNLHIIPNYEYTDEIEDGVGHLDWTFHRVFKDTGMQSRQKALLEIKSEMLKILNEQKKMIHGLCYKENNHVTKDLAKKTP